MATPLQELLPRRQVAAGAPLGNRNGQRVKEFRDALRQEIAALADKAESRADLRLGMRKIARTLVLSAQPRTCIPDDGSEPYEIPGSVDAALAIRDTIDGKPAQEISGTGPGGSFPVLAINAEALAHLDEQQLDALERALPLLADLGVARVDEPSSAGSAPAPAGEAKQGD